MFSDFQGILRQFDTYIVGFYPFHATYLISLWQRKVCFENILIFFCKGNTWNSKDGEYLKVLFEPY